MFPFGVDYYPEHWPQDRWDRDVLLMQAAGINIVRLAEFAWSYLEPSPGVYAFDWLDLALVKLQKACITGVLGTPTGSPPPWMMKKNPDY